MTHVSECSVGLRTEKLIFCPSLFLEIREIISRNHEIILCNFYFNLCYFYRIQKKVIYLPIFLAGKVSSRKYYADRLCARARAIRTQVRMCVCIGAHKKKQIP